MIWSIILYVLLFLPAAHDKGTLVIAGGNLDNNGVVYSEFAKLAEERGGDLLIITTASSPANKAPNLIPWANRGLHISSLYGDGSIPNGTDAIWIEGGDQCLLEKAYIGTPFEQSILDFYSDGGILGGSSAGAAFMSRVMIRGGTVDNLEMGVGLDLLPRCIIDQHFSQRNRLGRLEKAVKMYFGISGIGIDENTAVVYNGGSLRVVGENEVTILQREIIRRFRNGAKLENLHSR